MDSVDEFEYREGHGAKWYTLPYIGCIEDYSGCILVLFYGWTNSHEKVIGHTTQVESVEEGMHMLLAERTIRRLKQ